MTKGKRRQKIALIELLIFSIILVSALILNVIPNIPFIIIGLMNCLSIISFFVVGMLLLRASKSNYQDLRFVAKGEKSISDLASPTKTMTIEEYAQKHFKGCSREAERYIRDLMEKNRKKNLKNNKNRDV